MMVIRANIHFEYILLTCKVRFLNDLRFESSVDSEGSKTVSVSAKHLCKFESSVDSEGSKTIEL